MSKRITEISVVSTIESSVPGGGSRGCPSDGYYSAKGLPDSGVNCRSCTGTAGTGTGELSHFFFFSSRLASKCLLMPKENRSDDSSSLSDLFLRIQRMDLSSALEQRLKFAFGTDGALGGASEPYYKYFSESSLDTEGQDTRGRSTFYSRHPSMLCKILLGLEQPFWWYTTPISMTAASLPPALAANFSTEGCEEQLEILRHASMSELVKAAALVRWAHACLQETTSSGPSTMERVVVIAPSVLIPLISALTVAGLELDSEEDGLSLAKAMVSKDVHIALSKDGNFSTSFVSPPNSFFRKTTAENLGEKWSTSCSPESIRQELERVTYVSQEELAYFSAHELQEHKNFFFTGGPSGTFTSGFSSSFLPNDCAVLIIYVFGIAFDKYETSFTQFARFSRVVAPSLKRALLAPSVATVVISDAGWISHTSSPLPTRADMTEVNAFKQSQGMKRLLQVQPRLRLPVALVLTGRAQEKGINTLSAEQGHNAQRPQQIEVSSAALSRMSLATAVSHELPICCPRHGSSRFLVNGESSHAIPSISNLSPCIHIADMSGVQNSLRLRVCLSGFKIPSWTDLCTKTCYSPYACSHALNVQSPLTPASENAATPVRSHPVHLCLQRCHVGSRLQNALAIRLFRAIPPTAITGSGCTVEAAENLIFLRLGSLARELGAGRSSWPAVRQVCIRFVNALHARCASTSDGDKIRKAFAGLYHEIGASKSAAPFSVTLVLSSLLKVFSAIDTHVMCPNPCTSICRCGHPCQLFCPGVDSCLQEDAEQTGAYHDCLCVIVRPLPCFHYIPFVQDSASGVVVYKKVFHFFAGTCHEYERVRTATRSGHSAGGCECLVRAVCYDCAASTVARCWEVWSPTTNKELKDTKAKCKDDSLVSEVFSSGEYEEESSPDDQGGEELDPHLNNLTRFICTACRTRRKELRILVRQERITQAEEERAKAGLMLKQQQHQERGKQGKRVSTVFARGQHVVLQRVLQTLREPYEEDFVSASNEASLPFEDISAIYNSTQDALETVAESEGGLEGNSTETISIESWLECAAARVPALSNNPMRLEGAHGVVISSRVDTLNVKEYLYLVLLTTGRYVLITEDGVRPIMALGIVRPTTEGKPLYLESLSSTQGASLVLQLTATAHRDGGNAPLMIEGIKSTGSENCNVDPENQHDNSDTNGQDESTLSAFHTAIAALVGKQAWIVQPVVVPTPVEMRRPFDGLLRDESSDQITTDESVTAENKINQKETLDSTSRKRRRDAGGEPYPYLSSISGSEAQAEFFNADEAERLFGDFIKISDVVGLVTGEDHYWSKKMREPMVRLRVDIYYRTRDGKSFNCGSVSRLSLPEEIVAPLRVLVIIELVGQNVIPHLQNSGVGGGGNASLLKGSEDAEVKTQTFNKVNYSRDIGDDDDEDLAQQLSLATSRSTSMMYREIAERAVCTGQSVGLPACERLFTQLIGLPHSKVVNGLSTFCGGSQPLSRHPVVMPHCTADCVGEGSEDPLVKEALQEGGAAYTLIQVVNAPYSECPSLQKHVGPDGLLLPPLHVSKAEGTDLSRFSSAGPVALLHQTRYFSARFRRRMRLRFGERWQAFIENLGPPGNVGCESDPATWTSSCSLSNICIVPLPFKCVSPADEGFLLSKRISAALLDPAVIEAEAEKRYLNDYASSTSWHNRVARIERSAQQIAQVDFRSGAIRIIHSPLAPRLEFSCTEELVQAEEVLATSSSVPSGQFASHTYGVLTADLFKSAKKIETESIKQNPGITNPLADIDEQEKLILSIERAIEAHDKATLNTEFGETRIRVIRQHGEAHTVYAADVQRDTVCFSRRALPAPSEIRALRRLHESSAPLIEPPPAQEDVAGGAIQQLEASGTLVCAAQRALSTSSAFSLPRARLILGERRQELSEAAEMLLTTGPALQKALQNVIKTCAEMNEKLRGAR